tara:strand:- start:1134 stop:1493 length:360 start_codon:yes stop_codon:yes gene_type:complete
MKKVMKGEDGKYHVKGHVYEKLKGSRAQVWHGTAYKTKGDLVKVDLLMNKRGKIVSKKQHFTAKKNKRLEKYGYFTQKGKFGYVKRTPLKSKKRHGTRKGDIRKTARRAYETKSGKKLW